ncbi:gluconokinase [Schleiferiaceae bacterium]|nr:gluconokinase [Schleiferiaceae bacterium]
MMNRVVFIIGVSGSGKTHIGKNLADEVDIKFIDADDQHSEQNIEKMKSGMPLTDKERIPWLLKLNQLARAHSNEGCVISCSALKQSYRNLLAEGIEHQVNWVYLKGDYDIIYDRMKTRIGHFMKPKMLLSQFETLEEPVDSIEIDISKSPESIIKYLKKELT